MFLVPWRRLFLTLGLFAGLTLPGRGKGWSLPSRVPRPT